MNETKILNLQEKRQENVEKKRRSFERVVFQDFLGCYGVIDEHGTTYPVKLVDVSADGCMFQVPHTEGAKKKFKSDEDITLRVYFTKSSYIPVVVSVKHGQEYIDEKGDVYMRYGGEFDKTLSSFKAFETFIQFIYQYAEFSCNDRAQHKVYFL